MSQVEDVRSVDKVTSEESASSNFVFIKTEENIKEEIVEDNQNEEEESSCCVYDSPQENILKEIVEEEQNEEEEENSCVYDLPQENTLSIWPLTTVMDGSENNSVSETQENKKRQRRVNFSKRELNRLKRLVLRFPVIETKKHDNKNKAMKKEVWKKIAIDYNSDIHITRRTVDQLKGAWKRIKQEWKSKKTAQRNIEFKNGGGLFSPLSDPDPQKNEMLKLLLDQMPIEGIPEDNSGFMYKPTPSDGSESNADATSNNIIKVSCSSSLQRVPVSSGGSTVLATNSALGKCDIEVEKPCRKVVSHAQELHNEKMAFLKAEHLKKMAVLDEEMRFWRKMNSNAEAYGSSLRSLHIPLQQPSESNLYKLNGNVSK